MKEECQNDKARDLAGLIDWCLITMIAIVSAPIATGNTLYFFGSIMLSLVLLYLRRDYFQIIMQNRKLYALVSASFLTVLAVSFIELLFLNNKPYILFITYFFMHFI